MALRLIERDHWFGRGHRCSWAAAVASTARDDTEQENDPKITESHWLTLKEVNPPRLSSGYGGDNPNNEKLNHPPDCTNTESSPCARVIESLSDSDDHG